MADFNTRSDRSLLGAQYLVQYKRPSEGEQALQELLQDRFLRKDPSQNDQSKSAVYTSLNPAPKRGDDSFRKIGRPKGSEEDDGAPNILTGTVIVSCFIQTSALPSRIELQGNDLTFFDDTFTQGGQVIGDTSRLIFTHGSGKVGEVITAGFIMEKRASVYNTYDNVLSWYALQPPVGAHNYMFIGRNAYGGDSQRHLNSMHFAVNAESTFVTPTPGVPNPLNGIFNFEYAVDGVPTANLLIMGNSRSIGLPFDGFSAIMSAGGGGIVGFNYAGTGLLLYLLDGTAVTVGANMIPDTASAYDLGSPTFPFRNIYANSVALPGGLTWTQGTGSPEGVVTAPIGSLYSNISGGASTTLYVKTSGAGNTGWTAK